MRMRREAKREAEQRAMDNEEPQWLDNILHTDDENEEALLSKPSRAEKLQEVKQACDDAGVPQYLVLHNYLLCCFVVQTIQQHLTICSLMQLRI